jgi:hypothetical protein
MADLTTGRKPVDDQARALKRRRLELDVAVLKTDVMRAEVEILELEDQEQRKRELIVQLLRHIEDLERILTNKEPQTEG